jgi:hypothetical protein
MTDGLVCPNIGPKERQKRLISGIVLVTIGLAITAILMIFRVAWWYRLPVMVPYYLGALGIFQAREKT